MSVNAYVHKRFREVFGEPHNILRKDQHWALPMQKHPQAPPINILLNGSAVEAVVWVFDPHDRTGTTLRSALATESGADDIINEILRRLALSLKAGP